MLRGRRSGEQTLSTPSTAQHRRARQPRSSNRPEMGPDMQLQSCLCSSDSQQVFSRTNGTERPREGVAPSPPRGYRAQHGPRKQGRRDGSCCEAGHRTDVNSPDPGSALLENNHLLLLS